MDRAVFLDRDGTITRDVSYCRRPQDLELLPGVPQGLRLLNDQGFKLIVVTNQSGVARGYFNQETLHKIHDKMLADLAMYGAFVDAVYYCPHHPDDGCQCRKPNTGLFEQAAKEWGLDVTQAYVIGDREMDMVAARRLGCKAVLVVSPGTEMGLLTQGGEGWGRPDFIALNFLDAAQWVVADARNGPGVAQ